MGSPAPARTKKKRAGGVVEQVYDGLLKLSALRWQTFAIIFVLSMGVRLTLLMAVPGLRLETGGEAERIGLSLATNGTFADPYIIPTGYTAHCPPFYPLLISGIYRVFGTGWAGNMVRFVLLMSAYSALYGLFPSLARGFGFPSGAGVMAGLFSAAIPLNRSAEISRGWEEAYSAILAAGLFLFTKRIWRNPGSTARAGFYGFCWGVAYHLTPSLLPVQLGFGAVHIFRFAPQGKMRVLGWQLTALAATALTVLPWTLRNHDRLGGWIFMRSDLGIELSVANQDGANAAFGDNSPVVRRSHPLRSVVAALQLRDAGEIRYNHALTAKAVAWMEARPLKFFSLTAQRAIYFWAGPPDSIATMLLTATMTLLGFMGLQTMRSRAETAEFWLFSVAWLVYPLIYYVVSYLNRYRVPIEWSVTLCAFLFLWRKLEAAMER